MWLPSKKNIELGMNFLLIFISVYKEGTSLKGIREKVNKRIQRVLPMKIEFIKIVLFSNQERHHYTKPPKFYHQLFFLNIHFFPLFQGTNILLKLLRNY